MVGKIHCKISIISYVDIEILLLTQKNMFNKGQQSDGVVKFLNTSN